MFWFSAMFRVCSVSSGVVRVSSLLCIVVRSFAACFASSGLRSLCMLVCFHMALRASGSAVSTV